ncbi:MAG: hypothetical protein L0287_37915, partial [Anaerolineae bacterium]|nr:hypothetical protein [Anaerolineae bacterium]
MPNLDGELESLREPQTSSSGQPMQLPGMEPGLDVTQVFDNPVGIFIKPPAPKNRLSKVDVTKLVYEICELYHADLEERIDWEEARIQRIAKYRGWREKKTYPWEDASNAHLPIIMTDVQATEDTLHNAVMSSRPVMQAKSLIKATVDREQTVDNLIDYQIFFENKGEERIGNLISSFVQDGQWVAYLPYIREVQKISTKVILEYPGPGISWPAYLHMKMTELYPGAVITPLANKAPWEYEVSQQHPLTGERIKFRVEVADNGDNRIQVVSHHEETTFDGPSLIPVELEDIVVPSRSENLQPVTLANPRGSHHCFLVDYPTRDEIYKLKESGFYNQMTEEDWQKLNATTSDDTVSNQDSTQAAKR